jgi:hypothetical protein
VSRAAEQASEPRSRVVTRGILDLELWSADLPAVRLENGLVLLLELPIPGMFGDAGSHYDLFGGVPYLAESGERCHGYELGMVIIAAGDWVRGDAGPIETDADREIARRCVDLLVSLAFEGVEGLKLKSTSARTPERTADMAPWLSREIH